MASKYAAVAWRIVQPDKRFADAHDNGEAALARERMAMQLEDVERMKRRLGRKW